MGQEDDERFDTRKGETGYKTEVMGKLMLGIGAFGLLAGCQFLREAAQDGRGNKLTLAQANATPYVITLAQNAAAPEKTAAAELAAYLKKITGAEFAIVEPAAAAGRPVLARPRRWRRTSTWSRLARPAWARTGSCSRPCRRTWS